MNVLMVSAELVGTFWRDLCKKVEIIQNRVAVSNSRRRPEPKIHLGRKAAETSHLTGQEGAETVPPGATVTSQGTEY